MAAKHDDADTAVAEAIDASKRSGTAWHDDWSLTALGLLETSLGNYDAALNALKPSAVEVRPALEPHRVIRGVVLCPTQWSR